MLHITKVLTTGAATAGKTCTKHYIFDKPPPGQYTSTDLFESMGRHYAYYSAVVDPNDPCEWKIATLVDTLSLVKNYIRSDNQDINFNHELGFPELYEVQTDTSFSLLTTSNEQVHPNLETQSSMRESDTIKKLLDPNLKLSGEILKLRWIHFVDGGGQSEFLELLPALVSNVTVTIYVIDLTKKPSDFCADHFTISDRPQGKGRTHLTGEQMFERFLKTFFSQKDDEIYKVMIVGTHWNNHNNAHKICVEWENVIIKLCKEHNQKKEKVQLLKGSDGSNINKIEANCRDKSSNQQQTEAKHIRQELVHHFIEKPVAIAHFLIEEDLKSSDLAKKHKGILSYSECISITKQYATEKTLEEALQYFHELNEFFFFKHEGLVFTDPGVLVKMISNLIKVANDNRGDSSCHVRFWKSGKIAVKNVKNLLDRDLLSHFRHDQHIEFGEKELLKVLQNLFIAAPTNSDCSEYFIPCVLPPCMKVDNICTSMFPCLKKNKSNTTEFMKDSLPLLVTFEDIQAIPRGLFCGLVTYLIDKKEWKIHEENDQNYRTLIVLAIPKLSRYVVLEDKFKFLRVYVAPETRECERMVIRTHIASGVEEVSKRFYGNSIKTEDALECPCPHRNKELHAAVITKKEGLSCKNFLRTICYCKFTEDQLKWLKEDEMPQQTGN